MRRRLLSIFAAALASAIPMVAASGAQAIVLVDQNTTAGVAMMQGSALPSSVTAVSSPGICLDPALTLDLSYGGALHVLPPGALCYHGGSVMHANEAIAEVWDPRPYSDYASPYVEQFLRDVADGSGTLGSPYALTPQYTDGGGRAGNQSLFGGGYDTSDPYPPSGCPVSGFWHFHFDPNGQFSDYPNGVCLTDAQLQTELQAMVSREGLAGHIQPGYTPLLVVQTPPGVETCLDSDGVLCSANSAGAAGLGKFCSYHSQITVDGVTFPYVVQPMTILTGCDEPDAPAFPNPVVDPVTLKIDTGARLVSPLSRGELSAIVNPGLNGWYGAGGEEIGDNGCILQGNKLDSVTIGASGQNPYLIQRQFNNGGLLVNDPWAPDCSSVVSLAASFVIPSAADPGDVIKFDGSKSPSTLVIPQASYIWDFGDGTAATGPSVFHTYVKSGNYPVKLTVIDRGGYARSSIQTITVLGPTQVSSGLHVNLQLMPQGLKTVLRSGVAVRVSSNASADGIATLMIPRSAARRAHLPSGRGPAVVVGQGFVSGIKKGTTRLHLRLSKPVASKLARLHHVVLTVRLSLVAAGGQHFAIDVAGHY